ncbi:GrpB family protein [Aminithiophilus ramosus]|uniref:GrpB family protein n=2 Tax=Synergistales TaxID=649776 RepID=A0A9Q7A8G0_9BACT|nr:GrpB family protein [Aminithiophilus ramosus]QTX32580.1 GrpB family protein [Aminithiophilus ramosus]QVL36460.1 GrpB family protein [Synergistota bacterium]
MRRTGAGRHRSAPPATNGEETFDEEADGVKKLREMSDEELWRLFPIVLSEPDPAWKVWYAHEEKTLVEALGRKNVERIHHIGSTAVEGLKAKPTVDILLEIVPGCDLLRLERILKGEGYLGIDQPENPPPHRLFLKGYTEEGFAEKVFHLHVRYRGDWDELYFRDYLRIRSDAAREYERLKIGLKALYERNRDRYSKGKTDFVRTHTALARALFGDRYGG